MQGRQKKRPCKICGTDLNAWGQGRKGICPDCAEVKRSTIIPCAGRCKKSYQIRVMELLSMYFEPGVKGGKKFSLYYCSKCLAAARSRARSVFEVQGKEMEKAESRRERMVKHKEKEKE